MDLQNKISKSIIKTLCYSDVFDYPLRKTEIYKYFLGQKVKKKKIYETIDDLFRKDLIGKKGNFYFLLGQEKICSIRISREKESSKKWKLAKKFTKILSRIPTIKLIGVSGSLSMNNADFRDDIDLFFITSKNSLWLSRLLVNLILIMYNVKRKTSDSFGIDRICPNMFITPGFQLDRNLFSAHEVAQLKILVNKENAYERLVNKNSWIKRYMPNSFIKNSKSYSEGKSGLFDFVAAKVDYLFYYFQFQYMKKRLTTEKISANSALFHPKNKTNFVQILYGKKYRNYLKFVNIKTLKSAQNNPILASNYTPGY